MPCLTKLKSYAEGYEVNEILVDNRTNSYSSAAKAYNAEIRKHWNEVGDLIIFVHQDVAFDDDAWIRRLISEYENDAGGGGVWGAAGMSALGRTLSNLKYLETKNYITRTQICEKTEVFSVDECCFVIPRKLFTQIQFDEKNCHHWHLYAVDYCYEAKRLLGVCAYVFPETIYHKSRAGADGLSTDKHFLCTMWRLIRKYRRFVPVIYTPCCIIKTSYPSALLKLIRMHIKNILQ